PIVAALGRTSELRQRWNRRQSERFEVVADIHRIAGMSDRGERHLFVDGPDANPSGGANRPRVGVADTDLTACEHTSGVELLADSDTVACSGVECHQVARGVT